MSDATHPPLVLLGAQRSGTTAFAHALNKAFAANGGMFTVNGKLPYLLDRWLTPDDLAARHLRADEILHALRRHSPSGAGIEAWLARVETLLRDAARDVAEGVRTDAADLARRILTQSYRGATRWGDKYNEYLLGLARFDRIVPDARYILLIRHPSEVAASILAWTGDRPWKPHTTQAALEKWAAWHAGWLTSALPRERFRVVEYRRLCAGAETERLGAFVDLDLAPWLDTLASRRDIDRPTLPREVARVWEALQAQSHD